MLSFEAFFEKAEIGSYGEETTEEYRGIAFFVDGVKYFVHEDYFDDETDDLEDVAKIAYEDYLYSIREKK